MARGLLVFYLLFAFLGTAQSAFLTKNDTFPQQKLNLLAQPIQSNENVFSLDISPGNPKSEYFFLHQESNLPTQSSQQNETSLTTVGPANSSTNNPKGVKDKRHAIKNRLKYVPGEILVKFKKGIHSANKANLHNRFKTKALSTLHRIGIQRVEVPTDESVESLIKKYKNDPQIEYAEPNGIFYVQLTPNDPSFSELWGLHQTNDNDIDAPEAWNQQTGNTVVVANIDTGVDYNHEDLAENIWTNPGEIPNNGLDDDGNGYIDDYYGWDFFNNDNDPMDDYGHGTHTAGTIAAVGNNGIGVTGVNWQAKIMPVKFLNSSGGGTFSDAAEAILYASSMGAKISSNSWGCNGETCFSQIVKDALEIANQRGMLFVTAAGNNDSDNDKTPHYPCNHEVDNIICVAATNNLDNKAYFSNYGTQSVDLAAPGENILSTVPTNNCTLCVTTGYRRLNGTSMATPHVAGAAALILAENPSNTAAEIKRNILRSVEYSTTPTKTTGKLNLYNAINLDYYLSTTDEIVRIPSGGSIATGLNVTFLNGYNSDIDINFSSSTPEISAIASATRLSPTFNSTNLTINTTAGMSTGSYQLTITGTSADGTATTRIATITVIIETDTIETDLSISELTHPDKGEVGKWISVSDTIEINGLANAEEIFVHYYLSTDQIITANDIEIGNKSIIDPSSGSFYSPKTTLWIPDWYKQTGSFQPIPPGTYYLGAIINKDGQVPESNMNNNTVFGAQIQISAKIVTPIEWTAEYDTGESESARLIDKDASGNIIVSGDSNNTDLITIKYSPQGAQLWLKKYDGGGSDFVTGQVIDSAGNIYVSGRSNNGIDDDYLTIKYSPSGDILWTSQFDNGGDEWPRSIALDNNNNLYVTGSSFNGNGLLGQTIKYDGSGNQLGVIETSSAGMSIALDATNNLYLVNGQYLSKYSPNLNQVWSRWSCNWTGDTRCAHPRWIQIAPDEKIYLAGQTAPANYMAAKYDSDGNFFWSTSYGNGRNNIPRDFTVDTEGNTYITGYGDNGYSYDFTTVKFDTNGNQVWVARYDNSGSDVVSDIATDNKGNILITGQSCNFNTYSTGCSGRIGQDDKLIDGGWVATTIKYDSDGDPLWISRPKTYLTNASGLLVDDSGDVFITGYKINSGTSSGFWTAKLPNLQPDATRAPAGPAIGNIGEILSYSTSTADPEGDQIQYTFDWGDGTSDTTALMPSGELAWLNHSWTNAGDYLVKVRAIDEYGNASDWSGKLTVTITDEAPFDDCGVSLTIVDASVAVKASRRGNLFDGDLTTYWNNDGVLADASFEVVIDAPREIQCVKLAPRTNKAYRFNVYVDGSFVAQYKTASAATIELQEFTLPVGTVGTTVRIESVHHGWFKVHEVELWGGGTITGPQEPIADAGGPYEVNDDGDDFENVQLDGSGSIDPDGGAILSYEWFEAGVLIGTGVNPVLSFTVDGSPHTVTLQVTDDEGDTDTDIATVTVNPVSTGCSAELTIVDASVPVKAWRRGNLFDGDLSTHWNNDGVLANALFEVVLDTPREIQCVKLAPRTNKAYRFNVYVDGSFVAQYKTASAATIELQEFTLPVGTVGTTVRIESATHNWFKVHEIELWGGTL